MFASGGNIYALSGRVFRFLCRIFLVGQTPQAGAPPPAALGFRAIRASDFPGAPLLIFFPATLFPEGAGKVEKFKRRQPSAPLMRHILQAGNLRGRQTAGLDSLSWVALRENELKAYSKIPGRNIEESAAQRRHRDKACIRSPFIKRSYAGGSSPPFPR